MSKQDRTRARTPTDIEQKYNFGKTFAEVFNLITDAQKAAEEAQKAIDSLDHEQIFNLLTDNGKKQGIYRGDDGDVYINASYIKTGTIAAELVDTKNLVVTEDITLGEYMEDVQKKMDANNPEKYLESIGVTYIDGLRVQSPRIEGGDIYGSEIHGGVFSDLELKNYIQMRTNGDGDYFANYVFEHYVQSPGSMVAIPLTTMGWMWENGKDKWYLGVLAEPILVNEYHSTVYGRVTRAQGVWDFSQATVIGLNSTTPIP